MNKKLTLITYLLVGLGLTACGSDSEVTSITEPEPEVGVIYGPFTTGTVQERVFAYYDIDTLSVLELTEEQVKRYEGEYACEEVPYKLIFEANGTILMGAPEQSQLMELTPTKQHQFTLDALGVVLDFYPGIEAVKFTKGSDKPLIFKKQ